MRTLREPLGAALHFLADWRRPGAHATAAGHDNLTYTLLVYDFGGGTMDITLLRIQSQRQRRTGLQSGNGRSAAIGHRRDEDADHADDGNMAQSRRDGVVDGQRQAASANTFLLKQFCRSMLKVLPELSDEPAWQALHDNPKVNDVVQLGGPAIQQRGVADPAEVRDALLGPPETTARPSVALHGNAGSRRSNRPSLAGR